MACERGELPFTKLRRYLSDYSAAIPVCTDHICQKMNLQQSVSHQTQKSISVMTTSQDHHENTPHTAPPWPAQIKQVASGFQDDKEGAKQLLPGTTLLFF